MDCLTTTLRCRVHGRPVRSSDLRGTLLWHNQAGLLLFAHCVAMSARIAAISDFTSAAQSALSRTAVDAAPCDNTNSWLTSVLIRSTCVRIWFLAVWRICGVDALPVTTSAESPMTARGTFNS